MKKLIIALISSLPLLAFGRAPSTYSQVQYEVAKVSQHDLLRTLGEFVKASAPSRMIGLPGHAKARAMIQDSIKAYDPKSKGKLIVDKFTPDVAEAQRFYQSDFDTKVEGKIPATNPEYQKWNGFTASMKAAAQKYSVNAGTNVIWEKTGIDSNKVLVITAHYDTISHDPKTLLIAETAAMPGANYNATGVSVALALVKTLAQLDLNYTVQVVFLDWQGIGFLGSHRYALELKKSGKNVMGFLNLEMLGQDTSFFDKTKKTGNMNVYGRPQDEKFLRTLEQHGSKMTKKVTFTVKTTGFDNSDNIRLWENGFVGGTFTQNWEEDFNPKFYQTPQDTPETLNHQTLYHGYLFLSGAVLGTLLDITK